LVEPEGFEPSTSSM